MVIKAALIPAIIGLIAFVVGVVLLVVGLITETTGLIIAGIIVTIFGIAGFIGAYMSGRDTLHAICPECQKFMGATDGVINYSYVCNQYKENYDSNHKFRDYTFYYTCTIECPHCGSTSTFEYKTNAKTEPKANTTVDKYLKGLLKMKN